MISTSVTPTSRTRRRRHADAFGNALADWTTGLWQRETSWSHNTKEQSAGTGLVYMYQRWYLPETGTFLSTAPYPPMMVHEYTFAEGNPVGMVDPDGRDPAFHPIAPELDPWWITNPKPRSRRQPPAPPVVPRRPSFFTLNCATGCDDAKIYYEFRNPSWSCSCIPINSWYPVRDYPETESGGFGVHYILSCYDQDTGKFHFFNPTIGTHPFFMTPWF